MSEPTPEHIIDSVRGLLAWHESAVPKTVQMLRFHLNYDGDGVVLPSGFDELPGSAYVTKGLFADILYLTFQAAPLTPPAPASAGQRMAALTAAALATGTRVTIEIMQPKNPAEEEPFVAYVDGPGKAWRHVRNGPDLEEVLHAALSAYSHRIALKSKATP